MRLVCVHAWAQTLELLRYPAASVPTLCLPALFFLFFGLSRPAALASLTMASYAAFAVLGVAFFQFGVGIAADRISPWERYLRTLPVGVPTRFGARFLSALAFGLGAAGVVILVAVATTPVALTVGEWCLLVATLILGAIPFALLGIAIGYWAAPKAALPLANVLYLALAYAGGLWTAPHTLPRAVERIAPVLPTRAWNELLWAASGATPVPGEAVLELCLATAAFAVLAAAGYRRDEGQSYR
jgi:ABC-2 type transport system permease protein